MKKNITVCFLVFLALVSSCKKDASSNTLVGRWNETAYYLSIGGPGYWTGVSRNQNTYVQFNADGTIGGNAFTGYQRYILSGAGTITFYAKDNTFENYGYSIVNGVLQMGPTGPIFCIEGCAVRFKKDSNLRQLLP